MTRLLRVISGSDSSPTADFTDDVEWTETEFEGAAHNGESGISRFIVYDEDGRIPDYVGAGKFLNSHNVVTVDDGPYRLFRGRIGMRDAGRGTRRGQRTRTWEVTCHDYNGDLRGIVVDAWVRGSETDQARVQALVTTYLTGSPRATTSLTSTYVSGSNLKTLAAKTYSGVTPDDIMREIAEVAGKVYFVTVDGQVFYDGTESTAYASSLRISDDPADANATTYAPSWEHGSATSEDGAEQLTALRSYYGDNLSVRVTNTLDTQTDYWEGLLWDSTATTTAEATDLANHQLEVQAEDHISHTVTIGPIPWAQLGSIKWGQTIQFKARAARGGRTTTSTYTGDSFVTRRIASLRWQFKAPDLNFAILHLAKPPKTRRWANGTGAGSQALVTAESKADICEGVVASSCSDLFNRVADGDWGRGTILCLQWYASADGTHNVDGRGIQNRVAATTVPTDWIYLTAWSGSSLEFIAKLESTAGGDKQFVIYDNEGPIIASGPLANPDSAAPTFLWRWGHSGSSTLTTRVIATANGVSAQQGAVDSGLSDSGVFWLRCRLEYNAIRMRIWLDGSAEPGTWQSEATAGGSPSFLTGTRSLDDCDVFAVRHLTSATTTGTTRLDTLEFVSGVLCSGVTCDMCGTTTTAFGDT